MRMQRPATGRADLLPFALEHSPAAIDERQAKRDYDDYACG